MPSGEAGGLAGKDTEVSFLTTLPEVSGCDGLLSVHFSAHIPWPQRNLGICLKRALFDLKNIPQVPP